jgi:hypothetical protein
MSSLSGEGNICYPLMMPETTSLRNVVHVFIQASNNDILKYFYLFLKYLEEIRHVSYLLQF